MSTTKMSDPRDLFLHELGDILYAEKTLVKALPKLGRRQLTRSSRAFAGTSRKRAACQQYRAGI